MWMPRPSTVLVILIGIGASLAACADETLTGPDIPVHLPPEAAPLGPQQQQGTGLLSDLAVVIDPEIFTLVGGPEERANGIYRLRPRTQDAPLIGVGNYIVGTGPEEFLRRVTEIEIAGDELVLNTAIAFWPEVITGGRIEGTMPLHAKAPFGVTGDVSPAAADLTLSPLVLNFDNFDICGKISEIHNKHPILMPDLCSQRLKGKYAFEEVAFFADAGVSGLFVEEGTLSVSGEMEVGVSIDPGGIVGGRAPVFSPCNRLPNARGCLSKAGTAFRAFIESIGVDIPDGTPEPLRVCIPGTRITTRDGYFTFGGPLGITPIWHPPIKETCTITDYGELPTITPPSLTGVDLVLRPHIIGHLVLDTDLSGSLTLKIFPGPLGTAFFATIAPNLFAGAKLGLAISFKTEVIDAGVKYFLDMDEIYEVRRHWDPDQGWDLGVETIQDDMAFRAELQGVEEVNVRAAIELTAGVAVCAALTKGSCHFVPGAKKDGTDTGTGKPDEPDDPPVQNEDQPHEGNWLKNNLAIGLEGSLTAAKFVRGKWSRDDEFDNWHVHEEGGMDVTAKTALVFPFSTKFKKAFRVPLIQETILECCILAVEDLHGRGHLQVYTETTGQEVDPDGYNVSVHRVTPLADMFVPGAQMIGGPRLQDTVSAPVNANGDVLFGPVIPVGASQYVPCTVIYSDGIINNLSFSGAGSIIAGAVLGLRRLGVPVPNYALPLLCTWTIADYEVQLSDIADNCSVVGDNPRIVRLQQARLFPPEERRSAVKEETFEIVCTGDGATLGSIDLSISTTNPPADSVRYRVLIDGKLWGTLLANDGALISGLSPGIHTVALNGIPDQCTVENDHPFDADVTPGGTTAVNFAIACTTIEPVVGSLEVTTVTTGEGTDADGYQIVVDGQSPEPIGANGTLIFEALLAGPHSVRLIDVAANCAADQSVFATSVEPNLTTALTIAVNCEADIITPGGVLHAVIETHGDDIDSGGYVMQVAGFDFVVGPNEDIDVDQLPEGEVLVTLSDVAPNCTVAGENPTTAVIEIGVTTEIAFTIDCVGFGSLVLETTTTGNNTDPDGYEVLVAAIEQGAVGTNETITIDSIVPGEKLVTLTELSETCDVVGANPMTVDIVSAETQTVEFRVHCVDGQFGGNPHVTLLPPIGPTVDRRKFPGEFDSNLGLTIEICQWSGSECLEGPVATFNAFADANPASIEIRNDAYEARWLTSEDHKLELQRVYRIVFRIDALELAHADIFLFEGSCFFGGPDGGPRLECERAEWPEKGAWGQFDPIRVEHGADPAIRVRIEHDAVRFAGNRSPDPGS